MRHYEGRRDMILAELDLPDCGGGWHQRTSPPVLARKKARVSCAYPCHPRLSRAPGALSLRPALLTWRPIWHDILYERVATL